MNDAELIQRSLGDGEPFALLFDRHFRAIHRFVRARVGEGLADDLASDTFVVAFRRRATYDLSCDDARPWLYGIAVNLLRDHRRSEERRLRAFSRAAAGEPVTDEMAEPLDPVVARALLQLSKPERDLVLLYAWADLSYEQLANALELPVGTIRSRLSRTREKLRAHLGLTDGALVGGETS